MWEKKIRIDLGQINSYFIFLCKDNINNATYKLNHLQLLHLLPVINLNIINTHKSFTWLMRIDNTFANGACTCMILNK